MSTVESFKNSHPTFLANFASDPRTIARAGSLEDFTGKVRTAVALYSNGVVDAERTQDGHAFVESGFSELHRQASNRLASQDYPWLDVEHVISPAHAIRQR